MKRVDLCYHFSCNPSVFIVLSSVCGFCLIVVLCGKQAKPVSPFSLTFFDSHQYQYEQRLCHYRQRVGFYET